MIKSTHKKNRKLKPAVFIYQTDYSSSIIVNGILTID